MIQGKWFAPSEDLPQAVESIRMDVFGRGRDSLDAESWNVLVYQDGLPAATGRLWWQDGIFRLGDIGVLSGCRHRHLGDLVLRLLLFKAQSHFAREVRLQCEPSLSGFFDRLGLRPVLPADSQQIEMMIAGDAIDLDSCKSCPRSNCSRRQAD